MHLRNYAIVLVAFAGFVGLIFSAPPFDAMQNNTTLAYPAPPSPSPTSHVILVNQPYKVHIPAILNNFYVPTPPTSPGDAFYVADNWGNLVVVNGQSKTVAYSKGYYAHTNTPSKDSYVMANILILAFGRQAILSVDASGNISWGVNLPTPAAGLQSNAWVKARAEEFIQGYTDGHTITAAVVIGTSNDNNSWLCDESNNTVSSMWNIAGNTWGALVANITTSSLVQKWAGSDIETWNGETPGWVACGKGTLSWYDGFRTTAPSYLHLDFGSNTYVENNVYWTRDELYQISFGRTNALVAPQIYCASHVSQWVDMRRYYFIQYRGVTSTNGVGQCSAATGMYTWNDAWNAFNNGLASAPSSGSTPYSGPFQGAVYPSVISFNY